MPNDPDGSAPTPGLSSRTRARVAETRSSVGRRAARLRGTSTLFDSLARAWEYDSEIEIGRAHV